MPEYFYMAAVKMCCPMLFFRTFSAFIGLRGIYESSKIKLAMRGIGIQLI